MKILNLFAAFVIVLALLAGCVTGEKISKLTLGMTVSEVEKVMGKPDGVETMMDGKVRVVNYTYANRFISGFSPDKADYLVVFRDQTLASFAPVNIRTYRPALSQQTPEARQAAALEGIQRTLANPPASDPVFFPTLGTTPMEGANGFPSNSGLGGGTRTQPPPQMPSGFGAPTGRTQLGPDGTTYYEMRDLNGSFYWTNKK